MLTLRRCLLCLLITFSLSLQDNKKCRERDRLISAEKVDLYTIIDATLGQKLVLQCHYCNENDDSEPRNWYKTDKLGISQPHEVELGMDNNMNLNRISVNVQHSLIINDFAESDTGLYSCRGLGEQTAEEKFNYLVDLNLDVNVSEIETGDMTAWIKYHDDNFLPINKLFKESNGTEFIYIRDTLKVNMELISQWDNWGKCEVCGRPNNQGIRKKNGFCRIKLTRDTAENTTTIEEQIYFLQATAISCRSTKLAAVFPGISNLTVVIPEFVQMENCEGTCNPDSDRANAGWKVGKSKGFKYRKTVLLKERSHLTLVCPESSLENIVVWRKHGLVLRPGDITNPNMIVDTFSILYLIEVTPAEAGNYTCQVDNIKMQQVLVFVTSKSKLLTGEYLRHLYYLGFVLSLTLTCYCAGLIITLHRRHTFKSYEELLKENPQDAEEFENLLSDIE